MNPPSAQAVVGTLGSGKTTLQKLASAALVNMSGYGARRVHIVPVELWPYEAPRAAVEGVIQALLDALSREVNVLALRDLPKSYVAAMTSAGGMWSALAHLQGAPSSPFERLQEIDQVATAIGHRYVLWVEDLERFAGTPGTSTEPAREEERLNPIRSLLYGLDRLRSVKVVTATTSLSLRFDIEKIARFVEQLPDLGACDTARVLTAFRDGCRKRHNVIDPADPQVREGLNMLSFISSESEEIRRRILGGKIHSVADAAVAVCSTPRTLKQGLRVALETWDRLPGEIDFDDLLVMCLLRAAWPEAFAQVQDQVDTLRGIGPSRDEQRNVQTTSLRDGLARLGRDQRFTTAAEAIVEFVFGAAPRWSKPQGLRQVGHTDYWARLLAVPVLGPGERDQEILRVILSDDDSALLDLIEDQHQAAFVVDFQRMVRGDRLRQLWVPLVRRRSCEAPSAWPDGYPPGVMTLWRLCVECSKRGDLKPDDVLQEVRRALEDVLPRNPRLAVFLANPGREADAVLTRNASDSESLTQYLHRLLVTTFAGKRVLSASVYDAR